jgi:hypothetical protein
MPSVYPSVCLVESQCEEKVKVGIGKQADDERQVERRRRLLSVLEEKGVVEEDADGRGYSRRMLTSVGEEKVADDGCGRAKTGIPAALAIKLRPSLHYYHSSSSRPILFKAIFQGISKGHSNSYYLPTMSATGNTNPGNFANRPKGEDQEIASKGS